jgi:hypothetical protein
MPEPAAPPPSTTRPRPSPNGTGPPMPAQAAKAPAHGQRPAGPGRLRAAMAPIRRMLRRTASRP